MAQRPSKALAGEESMDYKTILVTDADGVKTITLNRPERRNAMTPEMQNELLLALDDAARDDSRVVILTGAGDAFCAGLDLVYLQHLATKSHEAHVADAKRIATLFRTLCDLPKPTIAVVKGPAIAGGTGLAMVCDFTLATPDAKFGFTEVKIGFVPALVSAFLALQVGEKVARDLLLTGRIFTAQEAKELGMINEVIPVDGIAERTATLVAALKANSPESISQTKRLLSAQSREWLDDAIEYALKANSESRSTHDFREGVAAFLEKRKPVWSK
jgi:methylglutaconyl-CoA hydratase